jgi:asparagine N-glycosylation enzyme membrane subunit Stt3
MGGLVGFLISLFILCIVFGLLWWLIQMIPSPPFPPIIKTIAIIFLILIAVVVLLGFIPSVPWGGQWQHQYWRN